MQEILDRWGANPTQYLLPIITRTDLPAYNQYKCARARANRCLHLTGRKLGLKAPLDQKQIDSANRTILRLL